MTYPTIYPITRPSIYPQTYPSASGGVFTPSAYSQIYNDIIISPTWHNGGFETAGGGGADVFAEWTEQVAGTSVISQDASEVHSGSKACKIVLDASGSYCQMYLSNVLVVGHTYKVTAYVKVSATTTVYIGKYAAGWAVSATVDAYTAYTVTATADAANFVIRAGSTGARTIYIDSVTVEDLNIWHGNIVNLEMQSAGTTEIDGSGFGNNGAVTGAVSVSAIEGKCRQFDGADDVITITGDKIGIGDVTAEVWFKPTGWGEGGYGRLIDNTKFTLAIQNASCWVTSDQSTTLDGTASSIALNKWHHAVITRTYNGIATIYINGVAMGAGASGTPTAGTNTLIGANAAGDRAYAGYIGATRIYNRILTTQEIRDNYNADCIRYGLPNK